MQENNVAEVLRELATGNSSRSETARLRDVVGEIEAALSAGVNRSAILEALRAGGFTMTLKSFESALYRIRKKRHQPSFMPSPAAGSRPQITPVIQVSVETALLDEANLTSDVLHKLDCKQRRERVADQFIKSESTHPLIKRIKDQSK